MYLGPEYKQVRVFFPRYEDFNNFPRLYLDQGFGEGKGNGNGKLDDLTVWDH